MFVVSWEKMEQLTIGLETGSFHRENFARKKSVTQIKSNQIFIIELHKKIQLSVQFL